MRVVLDTNVWVSALLNPRGTPGQILDAVSGHRIQVVTTEHLLSELREVIALPKIRGLLESRGLWDDARLLVAIHPGVEVVPDEAPRAHWLDRDADDDWVIECALTGGAEVIVTGDGALLELVSVEHVRIVSPSDFLEELG